LMIFLMVLLGNSVSFTYLVLGILFLWCALDSKISHRTSGDF
jgi:hypothetical protein